MTTPSEPHQVLRRYLTAFYGFALGLALLLAIMAIIQRGNVMPATAMVTQTAVAQILSPTRDSTQAPDRNTATPLPAIPPTPNEKTPSPLGVTATELRGLTVSLWHPWAGPMGNILQTIMDEFNRTNRWGLTVQVKSYEGFGRQDEAVEAALSSNSLPDVLIDYGYQARHWDEGNVFVDLTTYLDDPVWGLTADEKTDFYPVFWSEDLLRDDQGQVSKRVGLPYYRSAYVMFYNQSWGRELGYLEPPTTAEDFRERACAAADEVSRRGDKSITGKGGWLITPQPGALIGWIYAFGGSISDPSGRGYLLNTPETYQAFEYLKELQASGCAWFEAGVDAQSEFASRHALFVVGSLFDIPAQQQAINQADNPDEWLVIPFPSGSEAVVNTYGPSLFITHSTPAQQLAAWLAIEWLVYPPNQAEWVATLEAYPTRLSTLNYLTVASSTNPQWAEALELLPDARSEPTLPSWNIMRWALGDALTQLNDSRLLPDQIPSLLVNLDNIAAEITSQVP